MIEIKDINKAIEDQKPLMYDGIEISYEAYKFLSRISGKNFNMLFSELPAYTTQHSTLVNITCPCPICGQPHQIKLSKTVIKDEIKYYKNSGRFRLHYTNFLNLDSFPDYDVREETENCLLSKKPKDMSWVDFMVCNECYGQKYEETKKMIDSFYEDPLLWVNTHSATKHDRLWDRVLNVYTYPDHFDNIHEGWKYCGVRFKTRYHTKEEADQDKFDENYLNWKAVMEKTIATGSSTTVHDFIQMNFRDEPLSDSQSQTFRQEAIEIAEKFLNGLYNGRDTTLVLEYVTAATGKLLRKIKNPPTPVKVFEFGKFKGKTVHDVIKDNRNYVTWALQNVEGFTISGEELKHYNGEEWRQKKEDEEYDDEADTNFTTPS